MPRTRSRRGRLHASPRVSLSSRQKGADAFKHACFRLGRQPTNDILADLRDHGALVLDIQLCRDLEPLLIFLKDCPLGIHQVMIYDGNLFFGSEASYQEKLQATTHRMPQSVLKDQVQLWRLMRALAAFSSLRGTGLAVLELTGLPISFEGQGISLLNRCLAQTPSLQRLHLEGCGLQDRGLGQLLPHLGRRLTKLSHLSLAQNSLRDLRLVARLLQARASAQQKRQVVPLNVLDLSKNPWLGARRSNRTLRPWQRREMQSVMPISREDLLRVICLALRNGLLVKKVRLRYMGLRRDDLRPLQQMLRSELANLHAGYRRHFPLAELSLEGNPLEAAVLAAITHALQQLSPSSFWPTWKEPMSGKEFPDEGLLELGTAAPLELGRNRLRRTQSQPSFATTSPEIVERKALSEGDVEDSMDFRPREKTIKEFQEDLQILSDFLEARFRPRHSQRTRHENRASSEDSGMDVIATIPDMGMDFGFGPPVLHGTYSHTDTPPDTSVVEATDEHAGTDSSRREAPPNRLDHHARMQQMLRHLHLLAGEGEVPVEPVLRIALDAVNSEASFQDAEAQLQNLMRRESSDDASEEDTVGMRRSHSV
ncbi:unnamed protein product [Durusdinium trenchii]|uniref:ADP-ribosylation factor 1 n=2 Tax=Durusdinium trenchii TaxID=1381693 RepID=A0ABP0JPG1_9DINO